MSQTIIDKLDKIYETKLQIKSAIGTDSDVFEDYPSYIRSMGGGEVTYSYLDERLSYYVETSELESMGYITDSALSGYATQSYVVDYVATYGGSVDLSAYVTYDYIKSAYVTYDYMKSQTYLSSPLAFSGSGGRQYLWNHTGVSDTGIDITPQGGVYATTFTYEYTKQGDNKAWVSLGTLKNHVNGRIANIENTYATQSYVADYVYTYASGQIVDLSAYVTKVELNNASYISSVPSDYPTYAAIEAMGYATQSYVVDYVATYGGGGSTVIDENIIPKESDTYTLGSSSYLYKELYSSKYFIGDNHNLYKKTSNQINLNLNNSDRYVFHINNISSASDNTRDLGQSSLRWRSTYTTSIYADNAYISGYSVATKNDINAIFSYDSTTGTLTINTL